jgi:ribosomal protein S18 acetylase RimI-like enzyme
MSITIREYQPDDLPIIKAITVAAFDGVSIDRDIENQFGEINGHDWKWRKARHIDYDAEREPGGIFIADVDGKIAGYITTFSDHECGIGLIPNLALDAAYRGQGLGRALIQHALEHFRRQGLSHAKIETLAQNEVGQKLYPSFGFKEVSRQVHYVMSLDELK